MFEPAFLLHSHMEHAILFDILQGRFLCGLSSYVMVVDAPHAHPAKSTRDLRERRSNNPGKYLARYKAFKTLFKSFCKKENVTC